VIENKTRGTIGEHLRIKHVVLLENIWE